MKVSFKLDQVSLIKSIYDRTGKMIDNRQLKEILEKSKDNFFVRMSVKSALYDFIMEEMKSVNQ